MQVDIVLDVERLPKDRLLAFHSRVGEAEVEGRTFEITRSEGRVPPLGFKEQYGDTWTVDLTTVMKAVLTAITKEES